jgi:predicted DCC family thiol-disulfide oxidoreductase YuxK
VRFVFKHDRGCLFKFATMQSQTGRRLLQQHGLDPDDPDSLLLSVSEHGYTDSDAIIRIVTQFGGPWCLLKIMRVVPKALRDTGYRYLARNRYRWFGRDTVCMSPPPEMAERFLN